MRLTKEELQTIRIHMNAYKEGLCNQGRYGEAEDYQIIVDKLVEMIKIFDKAEEEYNKWIPMSERPPEVGQYVLISMDMNYVATAVFQGDYWESTFDLDWEDVLAWMPSPEPYRGKKKNETDFNAKKYND